MSRVISTCTILQFLQSLGTHKMKGMSSFLVFLTLYTVYSNYSGIRSYKSCVSNYVKSLFDLQLCGVRGGGNAAAQALYWQAKKGLSFVLAFESDRERNAAIMLARRYAFDCNVN